MKIVALVPARSGSKSIKNKNLKKINNKPLIYYAINTAKKSKLINEVYVSTDSPKIKNIALKYGAKVPFLRPKKISGDLSKDIEYIRHFFNHMKFKKKTVLVILQPTTPGRSVKIIDNAIFQFIKKGGDSLRSVSLARETPYKMWVKKGKFMDPFLGKKFINLSNKPRQALKKVYWQNGYVYITSNLTVKKFNNELGKKIIFFENDFLVDEIDYNFQYKNIQKKMNNRIKTKKLYSS